MSNRPTKQAKLDIFSARKQVDSARVEDNIEVLQPPTTSNTARVVPESHEEYVLAKTIDFRYVLEIHSQITDAERYRLLTSEGSRNVLLLDTIRQNRRKFLKSWLHDDRFSNWLVYTQLSGGGGGLCKTCILMQAHLTHGSLANAAFVKRPCIDLKKFIEKALSHRDAAYHREATLAVKDFISSMESGKDIDAGRAKQTAENKKKIDFYYPSCSFLCF